MELCLEVVEKDLMLVADFIEKPETKDAPSSRWEYKVDMFTPDLFEHLKLTTDGAEARYN